MEVKGESGILSSPYGWALAGTGLRKFSDRGQNLTILSPLVPARGWGKSGAKKSLGNSFLAKRSERLLTSPNTSQLPPCLLARGQNVLVY
jgi:hypothetical protein